VSFSETRAPILVLFALAFLLSAALALLLYVYQAKRRELTEARSRFDDFSKAASGWFWEMGEDLRFSEITGMTLDKHFTETNRLGLTREDVATDFDATSEKWQTHNADLVAHRPFTDFRFTSDAPGGKAIHLQVSGNPIFDSSGKFKGYRGTSSDITELVTATQALREQQDLLSAAIEFAPENFAIWDSDDRLLVSNRIFKEIHAEIPEYTKTGTSFEDFIRAVFAKHFPHTASAQQKEEGIQQRLNMHRNPGQAFERELWNGSTYLMREQRTPQGGIVTIATDITDAKRTEAALRASEQRLGDFAEASADHYWQTDAEHRYSYLSPSYQETVEQPIASLIGQPARNATDINFQNQKAWRHIQARMQRQQPFRDNIYQRQGASPGQSLWIRASGIPFYNDKDEFQGYRGVSTDITAEVTAREAAEQSDRRFFEALENVPDMVALYDPDDRLIYLNAGARQRFFEIFGGDFLGSTFEEFCRAGLRHGLILADEDSEEEWLRKIVQRHRHPRGAFRAHINDDPSRWYEIREHRTPDGGVLSIWIDITDTMLQDEQLRQAQKMETLGQLTGGLAHDFHNLLAIVLGNLDFAQRAAGGNDKLMQRLQRAEYAAKRGVALTRRLLSFSRQSQEASRPHNINMIIDGLGELLEKSITQQVSLSLELADDLWPTEVDPGDLEDMLVNMVLNARDAMPHGGEVTIKTENAVLDTDAAPDLRDMPPGDWVKLTVRDDGEGMDAATLERIFDPFFTTKGAEHGTGLGLSQVYAFVARSGGHIAATSSPGEGTIFTIHLPRSSAAVEDATAESEDKTEKPQAGSPYAGRTILIVDDEPEIIAFARDVLREFGYQTATALNAADAIRYIETHQDVDLVFSDIVMPGDLNGLDLCIEIQNRWPRIKTLVTSAMAHGALDSASHKELLAHLLAKPYQRDDLARAVQIAFAKNQPMTVISS